MERNEIWASLDRPWDILVVGGGITGAGILREAARLGLRALLVEQGDFASGTSSRSSKLVHGGLRYLKEGKLLLTWESVQERERLLGEAPGLIDPLGFLLATYQGDQPGRWTFSAGLTVYDLLALNWSHQHYGAEDFQMLAPRLDQEGLQGGFRYGDAQTDDARLVLRVIREAVADGGVAQNHVAAEELLRENGNVTGARLRDRITGRVQDVRATVVMNATGAWADQLRGQIGADARIRPLRGSHLIFPAWRLRVAQALTLLHPLDRRPVFVLPWEGVTMVGTTDVDHTEPLDREPSVSPEEVAYLMAVVCARFPSLNLGLSDVISTFSGVRPVIGTGKEDPSKESRDHVIWEENGLLTVTGGKLTTFRLIALDALDAVRHRLPDTPPPDRARPVLNPVQLALPHDVRLPDTDWRRLLGRYGADAPSVVESARPGELERVPGTPVFWAELRWAARAESVVHLDDLLLRRVRLGLLAPEGGREHLPNRIRAICQEELGWDDRRWAEEQSAYIERWNAHYGLPRSSSVPDWRASIATAKKRKLSDVSRRLRKVMSVFAGVIGAVALVLAWLRW
ncbi:MAG: glycerol-3-phosphate dehydrogenase/oxidase [Acidobacteriota bacterium]